tara:strand:+ start:1353 stop:1586 length:234 start_codon:yes stop_codon:yes gene_type:complete
MNNYDITETVTRHYPVLADLLTEREFKQYLHDKNVEITESSLRDYRHRDKKFVYIKKGQQVFYPRQVNELILKEMLT